MYSPLGVSAAADAIQTSCDKPAINTPARIRFNDMTVS
jgi:hypothetical protein